MVPHGKAPNCPWDFSCRSASEAPAKRQAPPWCPSRISSQRQADLIDVRFSGRDYIYMYTYANTPYIISYHIISYHILSYHIESGWSYFSNLWRLVSGCFLKSEATDFSISSGMCRFRSPLQASNSGIVRMHLGSSKFFCHCEVWKIMMGKIVRFGHCEVLAIVRFHMM